jgi:hypothetical protein
VSADKAIHLRWTIFVDLPKLGLIQGTSSECPFFSSGMVMWGVDQLFGKQK